MRSISDSLNAKSFLTLLACISPLQKDLSETLSTLRFAQNAATLKITPQINAMVASHKVRSINNTRSSISRSNVLLFHTGAEIKHHRGRFKDSVPEKVGRLSSNRSINGSEESSNIATISFFCTTTTIFLLEYT